MGKVTKARTPFGPLYKGFIARLKALGCVFCPECYAYLSPDHDCPRRGKATRRAA
jgi:hypothetical protein